MHSKNFTLIDEHHNNKKSSKRNFEWLKSLTLKRSSKSTIYAIQGNNIYIKYIKKNIYKRIEDDTCRPFRQNKGKIQHVISSWPVLTATEYIERHEKVCRYTISVPRQCSTVVQLRPGTTLRKRFIQDPAQVASLNWLTH